MKDSLFALVVRICGMVVSSARGMLGLNQYVVNSLLRTASTVVVSVKRMVVSCSTKGLLC